MCGIFGLITSEKSNYSKKFYSETIRRLALLSKSRGKDSSGLAVYNTNSQNIDLIKGDIPIDTLLKSAEVSEAFNGSKMNAGGKTIFGHARLVTNGSQLVHHNNQPIVKNDMVLVHNGIITNTERLWSETPTLERSYEIDSEIIPALLQKELDVSENIINACNNSLSQLEGTYSIALLFNNYRKFLLASNNGSLYYITDNSTFLAFASEEYILKQTISIRYFKSIFDGQQIEHLELGNGVLIDVEAIDITSLTTKQTLKLKEPNPLNINIFPIENNLNRDEVVIDPSNFSFIPAKHEQSKLLENNISAIQKLRRCTKCVLPETFPFIEYDDQGVCNYCNNYLVKDRKTLKSEFEGIVNKYKRSNGKADCIVPFSGGRDSSYSIHYLVNELDLKPIAYTYDWGMVTDLARRNIARICGKLGIEHIIVAADIRQKRKYIKNNIQAWLKKPDLGMVPLFMSGDKSFHYYLKQLQKKTGISLNIWGENYLEKTDFKLGFSGIPPEFNKKRIYSMSKINSLRFLLYMTRSTMLNPAYVNSSLYDNILGQFSRSLMKKTAYYNFFDYYEWDESIVVDTIVNEYDWEFAIDTKSSWRIGDGTAAFYNYIYCTVAGFSEFDTFRSNQIREGQITRDDAINVLYSENIARYETLRWYLEIVGLDFEPVIKRINEIPKLYN